MPQLINLGEHYGTVEFPDDWSDDRIVSAYKELEARRTGTPTPSPSAADYVQQAAGSAVRGAGGVLASIPEQIAIGAAALNRILPLDFAGGDETSAQDRTLYKLGQGIRGAAERIAPAPVPELQESFWATKVPQGVGSALAFMAGGLAGRAAKIPAWLSTSLLGSSAGTSEFYQDAIAKGADEATAQIAGTIGAAVGTSEALPIARIMRRLDGITGGTFSKAVIEAGKDTLEESLQEGAQQLAQNFTAQQLYDKDRALFDEVMPNAGAGGVTGFLISALTQSLGLGIGRRNQAATMRQGEARRRAVISDAVNRGELLGGPNAEAAGTITAPPSQPAPRLEQEAQTGVRLRDAAQNRVEAQTGATLNEITPIPAAMAAQAQPAPIPQGAIPEAQPAGVGNVPGTAVVNGLPAPVPSAGGVSQAATPGSQPSQAPGQTGLGQGVQAGPQSGFAATPTGPANIAGVQAVVSQISSQWSNPPRINIVQSPAEIPAEIRAEITEGGLNPDLARGIAHPESGIWLVASNLQDEDQARRTLLHEAVGHYGVASILSPEDFSQFMLGVSQRHADTELGRTVRSLYGNDPVIVGKEVVARLAENPQADPTLWQRIIATVRQWARAVFNVNVSDNDIQVLLAKSAKALREGRATSSDSTAFAGGQQRVPIKIQRADGTVVDGEFNGYYDLTELGKGTLPSIGWLDANGKMTHGMLKPGEQIIGDIPTFEQWKKNQASLSSGSIPWGFWVSPSGELRPVRMMEHEIEAKKILDELGTPFTPGASSGTPDYQMIKSGWFRAVFDRRTQTLMVDSLNPLTPRAKSAIRDFAIEHNVNAEFRHEGAFLPRPEDINRSDPRRGPALSIGEPGKTPQVFRERGQVLAAISNPGLSAEQIKIADDLAAVQASMSPDNLVGWLMGVPANNAEAYAQKKLEYIEDRRHLSQTPAQLGAMPTATEDERRAKEVAGATVLAHYGTDRSTEHGALQEIEEDQEAMTKAIGKIGKLNQAQIKSQFLTTFFNTLVSRYKTYLVNLSKNAPAGQNNQAEYRQALVDAERRLNEHEASPVAVQQALSHVAKNIPPALLMPNATNQAIIDWIVTSGTLVGKVGDKTRLWMTVEDGTGKGALMGYNQLGQDLRTLADIINNGEAIEGELQAFEQWFRASGKEGKVSARDFAQKYFNFRTQRDRAARVASAMEKEINDLDTRIRGNKTVLDKLNEMMTADDYVKTVREAAREAHVVVRALYESQHQKNGLIDRDRTIGRWRMRGPVTNFEYVVDLYPSSAQENNNRAQLSAFVQEAQDYAKANATANPLVADDYAGLADYIERFLLHPTLDPSTGFTQTAWAQIPGTNFRITPDPFEWWSSITGSFFKTIRDAMERIGGRAMRQVATDAYELDTVMRKVEAVNAHPKYGYQAQTESVRKALASHGWSTELFGIWDERIAEPVLAAGQNNLGPGYEAGDVIIGSGTKLTKADVDAIKLMKQWEDAILNAAPPHVKDKVGDLGVTRKAVGSGRYTMARLPAPWTRKFLISWADAKTPAEREKLISRDDYFRRVVLGYMGEFNPEFLQMNPASGQKSPMFKIYRKLALTEKQDVQRFSNIDEVVDFIANEMVSQNTAPDFITAQPTAKATMLAEIENFIRAFETNVINYKSSETFGGVPPPVIQAATANNAFTTPRGILQAPSTFYSYSTAADGRRMVHVGGLRSLMNLRVLQSSREAMAAMEAAKVGMDDKIQRLQIAGQSQQAARSQIIKETAADRKAGQIRYDYLELVNALKLMQQAFGQLERFEASSPDYYEHAGVSALNNAFGTVKTFLLSAPQAVTTNFWSGALLGPALFHWQTGQLLKAVRDVAPFATGGTALLTKTLLKRIAAMVDNNPEMAALLRKHQSFLGGLATSVIEAAEDWRRLQRMAEASGMVTPFNFRKTMANEGALKRTAGRLVDMERNNEMSWPVVATNKALSLYGVRHIIGAFKASTPRFFDNLINYTMIAAFDRETEFLKKIGWQAFQKREAQAAASGANWQELSQPGNILTPGELGLKSEKALNRYRELFMGLGSLDAVLLQFYQRTKGMTAEQREAADLLSDTDHAATALQYAAVSNVATETNRPYGTKGKGSDGMWRNIIGTFMGWVSNMIKQFSKVLQTHSGDPNPNRTINNVLTLAVTTLLLAAVGAWNWEFGDELTKRLFNVSSARVQPGNIQDPRTALTYFAQALVNTVPIVGSQLGAFAGVAFTGKGNPFDMTSLIPQLGFVSAIYNTVRRIYQTGDVVLPLADFARQWVSPSKILLNRMPTIRGLVDQSNAIRALNASAPPGTEIKWGQHGGGDVRYGPANDEVQKLIASAYEVIAHGGTAEEVQAKYAEAVAAFVRTGRSREDAVKAVATALAAKEPIRILTGREFTPAEEARWVARMTSDQKKDYNTAVAAWRLLSTVTGKDLNMTSSPHVGSGGGGRMVGMPGGLGAGPLAGGGRRRRLSSPRLTALSSYSGSRSPRVSVRAPRGRRPRRSRTARIRSPRLMRTSSSSRRSSILRRPALR